MNVYALRPPRGFVFAIYSLWRGRGFLIAFCRALSIYEEHVFPVGSFIARPDASISHCWPELVELGILPLRGTSVTIIPEAKWMRRVVFCSNDKRIP